MTNLHHIKVLADRETGEWVYPNRWEYLGMISREDLAKKEDTDDYHYDRCRVSRDMIGIVPDLDADIIRQNDQQEVAVTEEWI